MRAVLIIAAFALTACESSAGFGRSAGIATYDDLKKAHETCAANGGSLKLQKNGDPQFLDDYACEKN